MLTTTFSLATLTLLAAALPTSNFAPRAGGPTIKPIPPTCSVTNPVDITVIGADFIPLTSAKSAILYEAYYPSFSTNKTEMATQCLEQCYGYGNSTECKAAFWAENVTVPAGYYGSPGGNLETACIMFDRPVAQDDFGHALPGQGLNAYIRNLAC